MHLTFHPLTVAPIRQETPDAVSITFNIPKHLANTFAFKPGQYLTLRADLDGEDIRRN